MACPEDQFKGPWETPVIREESGKPIGVTFTLTEQDLIDLGVEIESKETLCYYVADGKILLGTEKGDNY